MHELDHTHHQHAMKSQLTSGIEGYQQENADIAMPNIHCVAYQA